MEAIKLIFSHAYSMSKKSCPIFIVYSLYEMDRSSWTNVQYEVNVQITATIFDKIDDEKCFHFTENSQSAAKLQFRGFVTG